MKGKHGQGKEIRQFILNEVRNHPKDIVHFTEEKFQITRQAIYRHTHTLINKGYLVAEGNTRK